LEEEEMPKRKYALERGGDKSLEIFWEGNWKNTKVRLNGNLIGAIPNKKELGTGQIFQLPDGTALRVQLVNNELRVLRNDKPLPGSSSDPAAKLAQSFGIIYFIAGLNIVLGFIALIFPVEFLKTLGFGIISVAIGFIFLVLGFFTQRRSLIALIIALIIYSLDTVLALFSGFNTALVLSSGFNILALSGDFLMRIAPVIGWIIIRIGFLMGMGQGVGAINELKKETPPTVS
jgi:hypothetical protein